VKTTPSWPCPTKAGPTSALAAVADGPEKAAGIAVGRRAASDVLAARVGDGLEAAVPYTLPHRTGTT